MNLPPRHEEHQELRTYWVYFGVPGELAVCLYNRSLELGDRR
jgi:hypothetical protein